MMVQQFYKAVFKVLSVILVVTVLLPSAVKLTHAFNHHEHVVCNEDGQKHTTHFHQTDVDCEFYKFKLNNSYYFDTPYQQVTEQVIFNETLTSYYLHLRTHQQDTFKLRGPPGLV